MKHNFLVSSILGVAAAGVLSFSATAAEVNLTGLGYVEYGDGLSYSMPIANYQFGYNTNNGPYAISSTPGAIKDLIVIATGTNGNPVTSNGSGFDKAYETPTGKSGSTYFYPNAGTSRGSEGTIANNLDSTWDANVASLANFVGGEQMVFFFNNNNINSGASSNQTLAAWAQIWITDANGNLVGDVYEFSNNSAADGSSVGNPYAIVTEGGGGEFFGDPAGFTATNVNNPGQGPVNTNGFADTDYVVSGGAICVATGGGLPVPTPTSCSATQADLDALYGPGTSLSPQINHNLGADHVAYSVIFPELNAALAALGGDLNQYTMHVDVRMGCMANTTSFDECGVSNGEWGNALNNGYEQIFIGRAIVDCPPELPECQPPEVPTPNTISMFGLGLVTLWLYRRRLNSVADVSA